MRKSDARICPTCLKTLTAKRHAEEGRVKILYRCYECETTLTCFEYTSEEHRVMRQGIAASRSDRKQEIVRKIDGSALGKSWKWVIR